MYELLANLALGFSVAASPINLGLCLLGALVGTLIGVLPGIGPLATIAMLLPITFGLPPVGALIMLAGIYYGAMYGGSTTAILVNIPGESASVVTTLDGFQMAKQGRAGPALAIAAIGIVLRRLRRHRVRGGARQAADRARPEVRAGRILFADGARPGVRRGAGQGLGRQGDRHDPGRTAAVDGRAPTSRPARPAWRSTSSNCPTASASSCSRWACSGSPKSCATWRSSEERDLVQKKITGLMPTKKDFKAAYPAVLRGTFLGSLLGILPGGGTILAAFGSYTLEKKLAKDPVPLRQGRDRGRRRSRERQQRRLADLVHSAARRSAFRPTP